MEERRCEVNRKSDNRLYIRASLVGVIIGLGSIVVILRVGTLYISRISIRVSLVDPFRMCFRFPREVSQVLATVLAIVIVGVRGICLLAILVAVDVLQFHRTFKA